MKKVTTKLGRITAVMPYGRQAGHFHHVTLRLTCEDPARFDRFLLFHDGPRVTRVRVILLHWRQWQEGVYPLHQALWPPEQNPGHNANHVPQEHQVPQHPQPRSQDSTMSTGDGSDTSGEGSNSVNGRRAAAQHKKAGNWRIKRKIKGHWVPKKKNERRTTQMTAQLRAQKEKNAKPHTSACRVTPPTPQKGECLGLVVLFNKSKQEIQISDGKGEMGLVKLALTFLLSPTHQRDVNIKCSLTIGGRSMNEVQQKACKYLQLLHSVAPDWLQSKEGRKMKTVGESLTNTTLAAVQMDSKAPIATGQIWAEDNGGLQAIIVEDEELTHPPGFPTRDYWAEEEDMGLQSLFVDEEMLPHPPGFPTQRYANQQPTRRSPRLNVRKNYGETKRAKGVKLKIDFENRSQEIEADLALELLGESGAKINQEVHTMFHQAMSADHMDKENQPQIEMVSGNNE